MKEYKGVVYSYRPSSKDFPLLGMMPHLYLYIFIGVVADHVRRKVGSRINDPSYEENLTAQMKEAEVTLRSSQGAVFNSSTGFIDQHFKRAIEKIAEDKGAMVMWNSRVGDDAHVSILPGTSFVGGFVELSRRMEYYKVDMPSTTAHPDGSAYMLLMRDVMCAYSNGIELGSQPYQEEAAKRFCVKWCEMMNIDPAATLGADLDTIIDGLYMLKPSGSKTFIASKFCDCCHLLAKFQYYDGTDREWDGLCTTDEFASASVLVAKAWIAYLVKHDTAGTRADYVKCLASWLGQSYEQWKLAGRYEELPKGEISLHNPVATAVRGVMSDMLKEYAEEVVVSCWTEEQQDKDVVMLLTFGAWR